MIAGQRWSAATSSARIAPMSGLAGLTSDMVASAAVLAERQAAGRQRGDGDEEVRRLGRIGTARGLRSAFGGDEPRIARLPAGELPVEEGAARGAVRQGRQMPVEAGEKAVGAPGGAGQAVAAATVLPPERSWDFRSH